LDLALASLKKDDSGKVLGEGSLTAYVKKYAPGLTILCVESTPCKSVFGDTLESSAEDPPTAIVQRDSGRAYLYLSFKYRRGNSDLRMLAQADIQSVFANNLPAESDFDALLLVDANGRVITQHSATGLEMASVDHLQSDNPGAANAASAPAGSARGGAFQVLR